MGWYLCLFFEPETTSSFYLKKPFSILKEKIAALEDFAGANPLRDVWRFTSPLEAAWNRLNPLRNNPKFQHWGVLVADMGKDMVEGVMKHRKEFKKEKRGRGMGFIHELSRVGRQSAYRVYKWMSNAVKAGCQLMCVGKTRLKDDEILVKGHSIINKNPEYVLGSADCQSFAMSLLKEICCTTDGGRTVEEMMETEKLKRGN